MFLLCLFGLTNWDLGGFKTVLSELLKLSHVLLANCKHLHRLFSPRKREFVPQILIFLEKLESNYKTRSNFKEGRWGWMFPLMELQLILLSRWQYRYMDTVMAVIWGHNTQIWAAAAREFNLNLPFYLQNSNSCCNSSHNVGVFFQALQDLFKATLRRKVFQLETSRSMTDCWSGKAPHLHLAPLCLSRPAGGAVCPAAARWKLTLVLLLKPGAHKVGVVGETTALELEEAGTVVSFHLSIQKRMIFSSICSN